MATRRLGIVMDGVTGRMGLNQHLVRSILAIREQGGVALPNGDRVMPDPILVGRNAEKVAALARQYGIERSTTDLDAALKNPKDDSLLRCRHHADARRPADQGDRGRQAHLLRKAGRRHARQGARGRAASPSRRSVKNGVVQDKLFLPGLRKIKMLRDAGFFGRMLAVRGEFGYWVFEGDWGQPAQRPSWNYKKAEGGGIILDMLCHWRYVLDNLFGKVQAVSCLGADAYSRARRRERQDLRRRRRRRGLRDLPARGRRDRAHQFVLGVRVRRDDLVTFQVDGTHGSAVAGLTQCSTQSRVNTPRPVWNPDVPQTMNFFAQWDEVPDNIAYDNGFKLQWEDFIRHVCADTPWQSRPDRRRQGRAACRARPAELGRAALARRAGDQDLNGWQ